MSQTTETHLARGFPLSDLMLLTLKAHSIFTWARRNSGSERTIYLRRKSPVGIKVSNKISIAPNYTPKYNSQKYSGSEQSKSAAETNRNTCNISRERSFHWFHIVIGRAISRCRQKKTIYMSRLSADSYLSRNDHLALFEILLRLNCCERSEWSQVEIQHFFLLNDLQVDFAPGGISNKNLSPRFSRANFNTINFIFSIFLHIFIP